MDVLILQLGKMYPRVYISRTSEDECGKASYFQDIVGTLQLVKRPGSFAAGGTVPLPFPALQVKGIPEKIGLPINGPAS